MAAKIRQNDEVIVLAGKDKGKRGKVTKVLPNGKVFVEGINIITKHEKPVPALGQAGGLVKKEAAIDASNVAIFNPKTNKAVFSSLIVGYFTSAVKYVTDIFAVTFELNGLGVGELIFLLVSCLIMGYVGAWIAATRHIAMLDNKL